MMYVRLHPEDAKARIKKRLHQYLNETHCFILN